MGRPELTAAVWLVAATGCEVGLSGDCPAGTTYRHPLCVPDWLTGSCDQDQDDFLDNTCGGNDCAPTDSRAHPRAPDLCNGKDDDCDGATDEDAPTHEWYRDQDGDQWGDGRAPQRQCDQPTGTAARAGDCDDGNPERNPGAAEQCDGVDNDCDGFTDEGALVRFYRDRDGDGFGTPYETSDACEAPAGFVATGGDCDDGNRDVRPDQAAFFAEPSALAGFDYDCDGSATPQDSGVVVDCSGCTRPQSGWAGWPIPDCGQTGTRIHCDYDEVLRCFERRREEQQVQRCR